MENRQNREYYDGYPVIAVRELPHGYTCVEGHSGLGWSGGATMVYLKMNRGIANWFNGTQYVVVKLKHIFSMQGDDCCIDLSTGDFVSYGFSYADDNSNETHWVELMEFAAAMSEAKKRAPYVYELLKDTTPEERIGYKDDGFLFGAGPLSYLEWSDGEQTQTLYICAEGGKKDKYYIDHMEFPKEIYDHYCTKYSRLGQRSFMRFEIRPQATAQSLHRKVMLSPRLTSLLKRPQIVGAESQVNVRTLYWDNNVAQCAEALGCSEEWFQEVMKLVDADLKADKKQKEMDHPLKYIWLPAVSRKIEAFKTRINANRNQKKKDS